MNLLSSFQTWNVETELSTGTEKVVNVKFAVELDNVFMLRWLVNILLVWSGANLVLYIFRELNKPD